MDPNNSLNLFIKDQISLLLVNKAHMSQMIHNQMSQIIMRFEKYVSYSKD